MTELTIYYTEQAGRASDSLLREAAARYTGWDPAECETVREPWKKPVFARHPELCASVSHSGGVWAAAFAWDTGVGLDIQEPVAVRRMAGIARRFYHLAEREAWEHADDPAAEFVRIWCRKEAAAKQSGRGIDGSFALFDTTEEPSAVFGETLFLRDFTLPDFPALFCAAAYPEPFEVRAVRF